MSTYVTDQQKIIDIYENNVFAGTGALRYMIGLDMYVIYDCPAVLGDNDDESDVVYAAIEDAIAVGNPCVRSEGGRTWTWQIRHADEDSE